MPNNIIIFGADGYIGWPLAIHLGCKNPEKKIVLVDNLATRKLVRSVHTRSLVPIRSMPNRIAAYERVSGHHNLEFVFADSRDSDAVDAIFAKYHPESVVHLAQQRSAPFSMIDQEHAMYSELNNIATNMNILYGIARNSPEAHLLKMGSMGEYGQPGVEIAEGEIEIERKGKKAKVMFPLNAGSYYHLSKIFDTFNVKLANKLFDITATDIMQGVVYGTRTDELNDNDLATRFDFDSIWGTLINKYVIQAVALNKLLIYGKGKQKRGFLSLHDSIKCMTLLLEHPPKRGEYRIVNQLDEIYDTLELARKVQTVGKEYGVDPGLECVQNPRTEKEDHPYEVETKILPSLGFRRTKNIDIVLHEIFEVVIENKARIGDAKELIYPTVEWKSGKLTRSPMFKMPKEMMSIVTPEDMDYDPSEAGLAQEQFEVAETK
ncbi:MAG: NAD-dependent epimerase/dehydratase family protein [Nitrososphaerota archaeon]|nr:NAD-dependent epimerase/dehydratase family protein [Nitrososphaerota archaeon]